MDNNPTANAAPLWTVGVPQQTTIRAANGSYIPGWDVPVILVDKSTFTVQVAADQFNPQKVQELIEDHVNRVTAIRSLTGPTY